jgi:uncharacterized protein (DUF2235 family)
MSKNIILCSDGTGNKGGYTPDSNVYKLYQSVDIHDKKNCEQIIFYDNGIGTQTNKYRRAIAGAFGFGFQTNVCDLYEFLSRNYQPNDKIYMFGFSRGAATIRAFNGFVHTCGLIDGRDKGYKQLRDEIDRAMEAYQKPSKKSEYMTNIKIHEKLPEIEFIGVWDTVSALGFPQRTDVVTGVLYLLDKLFMAADFLSDKLIPHNFYNYELTPNVVTACQALAIDDERTSFWPMVWKEKTDDAAQVKRISQVWFAGMHSNVGGGYERAGLANVTYKWMLDQINGIKFKDDVVEIAESNRNEHGRTYNSRHRFASFYRYHPREIEALCNNADATVKIHESVLDRLRLRTANYAPRVLPEAFRVVDNSGQEVDSPTVYAEHWELFKDELESIICCRKVLYGVQLNLALLVLGASLWLWNFPVSTVGEAEINAVQQHGVDILRYFTPTLFDNMIHYLVVEHPWLGGLLLLAIGFFLSVRGRARRATTRVAEKLRRLILKPNAPYSNNGPNRCDRCFITCGRWITRVINAIRQVFA